MNHWQLLSVTGLTLAAAMCSGCAVFPSTLARIPGLTHGHESSGCGDACPECGDAPCEDGSTGWCDVCRSENCGCSRRVGHSACAAGMSVGGPACEMFGNVANFCVPAGAIGGPEIPPPGRFHPVPTNPVFARGI